MLNGCNSFRIVNCFRYGFLRLLFYGFTCIRYGFNCFKLFCRGVGAFDYGLLTFLFFVCFFLMVSLFFVRFETFGCFIEFHVGCNIFMVLIMRGWMLTVLFYFVLICMYVSIVLNTFVLFALCGFQ